MIRVRIVDSDCEFDVTKEELSKMCESDIFSLEAVNECDEYKLFEERRKFRDPLKLRPYYAKDDKINDPDGGKNECYNELYDYEEYNESNLLKYNHPNVKIFNELIDDKYVEVGDKEVITDLYIIEEWPEWGDAFDSIAYGYDQDIVYKNLCAAFGKNKVDVLWNKYYAGKPDGLKRS